MNLIFCRDVLNFDTHMFILRNFDMWLIDITSYTTRFNTCLHFVENI
jgi:hypothetical protein